MIFRRCWNGLHYTYRELSQSFIQSNEYFSPQQLNFSTIASQIGIRVFYWSDKSQALFYKNNSYIFLNDFLSTQQQWQDFCHELAHVLYILDIKDACLLYFVSIKRTRQTTLCTMPASPLSCWMR